MPEPITYQYCVKHDSNNVTLAEFFAILDAIVVATMAQLAIIESPAICCVAESLFRVNISAADSDFDELARVDLHFEEVAAARSHGLVSNHCLKGVTIAHCDKNGPQVLVYKIFIRYIGINSVVLFRLLSALNGFCHTLILVLDSLRAQLLVPLE